MYPVRRANGQNYNTQKMCYAMCGYRSYGKSPLLNLAVRKSLAPGDKKRSSFVTVSLLNHSKTEFYPLANGFINVRFVCYGIMFYKLSNHPSNHVLCIYIYHVGIRKG